MHAANSNPKKPRRQHELLITDWPLILLFPHFGAVESSKIWDEKRHLTAVKVCRINMSPLFYFGCPPRSKCVNRIWGNSIPEVAWSSAVGNNGEKLNGLKGGDVIITECSTPIAQWSEPQGYCLWSASFIDHDTSFPLLRTIWGVLCFHQNAPRPDWWNCYTSRLRSLRFTPCVL